jgi:hypothetical protein
MKFKVALDGRARLRVRELRRRVPPSRARADRLAGPRADARLPGAGGGVEDKGKYEVVAKFMGGLWAVSCRILPLDVVAARRLRAVQATLRT